MWRRLRSLLRVTAVRLSIAYTLTFGILAVILVFYMTGGAVDYLRRQLQASINDEIVSLERIYRNRGLNALIRVMERRANAPGANLYVVSDAAGRIIAGNVRAIDQEVLTRTGWALRPFSYEGFAEAQEPLSHRAVARVFELPNGMRVLIGQDIGHPERLRAVVRRALSFSMAMMLVAGFLIWFFVGRRALKRIDLVSKSTERILAGDRSERLPVTGANDEFDRLSRRMNVMLDRISQLDEGLRDVSDSIAHDLKTPLTRMRNKADAILSTGPNAEKSREALNEIIAECDQLIKTFNALLMISRVEAGSQLTRLSPLDMSEVMADVADLYGPVAEEEGFRLDVAIATEISVLGSRELLSQAVANLLDNALKYGHPTDSQSPAITMRLTAEENEVTAVVADNGPGIAEAEREKVRERFARLDESRSKPGTGLGLSLVEAVAKLHGGRLELGDAEPGLLARLILPRLEAASRHQGEKKDG